MNVDWISFGRGRPCPVCGREYDRCACRGDGLVCCRTTPPPVEHTGYKLVGPAKDGSGLLFSPTDGTPHMPPPKVSKPVKDFERLFHFFHTQFTPDRRSQLAGAIGLPVDCLAALPVGYAPRDRAFVFAEVDANGKIIGLNRRFIDGSKKMIVGSNRGLYIPGGWDDGGGPILVVQGASDVLALVADGRNAIGRPHALGGVEHLVELLAPLPKERLILVVGENDRKPDGRWPGKEAAISVARQIAERLSRPVKWSLPPSESKDVRAWLNKKKVVCHG